MLGVLARLAALSARGGVLDQAVADGQLFERGVLGLKVGDPVKVVGNVDEPVSDRVAAVSAGVLQMKCHLVVFGSRDF